MIAKDTIHISFEDGSIRECAYNTSIMEIMSQDTSPDNLPYIGALVNHEMTSLASLLEADAKVTFLTMKDPLGWHIYRRSVSFLLAKAVQELFPKAAFAVEHSLGTGFFCSLQNGNGQGAHSEQVAAIERRMRELNAAALPIRRRKVPFVKAVRYFEQEDQWDKYKLLRFRNPAYVEMVECNGFFDLSHGVMAKNTSDLRFFKLIDYPPGFVLQFPERDNAPELPEFEMQPHLFQIFKEYKTWGKILNVRTVGDLNEIIADKKIDDFIRTAEALQEKKIAQIADLISERRGQVKWIFLAGPSSSGKTTFAKRLAVQLKVNGLTCQTISVDDYFVDRDDTPLDEEGKLDFENLETVDLPFLHQHFETLDQGGEVELPSFNFALGQREFHGHKMMLAADQLVIVEGIHCLNPRVYAKLPPGHIFKIYISALTQLNVDLHNRISTTDNRLIRRMVRDNRFRGNDALRTLSMWPSVRRGEKKWIFPFQQESDVAFNSALDYELAVLKTYVEPLLWQVKPYHEQYAHACRLMNFLEDFLPLSAECVNMTSILREFIGDSSFRY